MCHGNIATDNDRIYREKKDRVTKTKIKDTEKKMGEDSWHA